MILKHPFEISPSLLPGLHIGDSWLEMVDYAQFRVLFEDGSTYEIEDFHPAPGSDIEDHFASILSFLTAWREGAASADLFDLRNDNLVNWIASNADLLVLLEIDLMERDRPLILCDDTLK
jgi:hypothetical protein